MSRKIATEEFYQPQTFEKTWQKHWQEAGLFLASESGDKPKYYCLDFFPYPSGDGLHVGHCRNYIPTDVLSRFKRMQGYNVLHPMGWDAFGEPAEQYAVSHGVHPRQTTDRNTANFRRQFDLIGASYDWSREIDSSDPAYYHWTQAFFLLLYERGLAYRDTNWQWWCPGCQTTLSSHEVKDGVCWRGHSGVTRRNIPAWYFRITAYADRLLEGLERIDWPEHIKAMQRNWIGRSHGALVQFPIAGQQKTIEVFTTRPDTLFGVTFLVLAPEHTLVDLLIENNPNSVERAVIEAYRDQAARQSEVDRMNEARKITGVFSGCFAVHPLTGETLPVWIADYVLPGYGTGAVMGVPAHDQRDQAFAHHFGLGVKIVIASAEGSIDPQPAPYLEEGILVNSGAFDGMINEKAASEITKELGCRALGRPAVQYRMRDWLISRQRYWGAPIPIVHCPECGEMPVPADQLPVLLPPMENFQPDGSGTSPLARAAEFVNTTCPRCGGPARRETDTMGGFACSSWYFLRFTSPHEANLPFDPEKMKYWMPVDLYVGGAEHAVLHLLYARFWIKVMYDAGLVPFDEPFQKLLNQGQLMAPDGKRMSKSRGNVITPDAVVQDYGADALRLYCMFMAPFDQELRWSTEGINGARRFLNRVWMLYANLEDQTGLQPDQADAELERRLHRLTRQVTERLETLRFNTMISALMEFTNWMTERQRAGQTKTAAYRQALRQLLVLMAPAVPFICEELWQKIEPGSSVLNEAWPSYDQRLAEEDLVEIPVQINGKLRVVIKLAADASEAEAVAKALPLLKVYLAGKQILRQVYAPGRALSLVVREASAEQEQA